MYKKNVANQSIFFVLVNATTGAALTGATVTARYTIDNGGTQQTGAGSTTELGNGHYRYVPAQAETNGTHIGFLFSAASAIPVSFNMVTDGAAPDSNMVQMAGNATAAGALSSAARTMHTGQAVSGTLSTTQMSTNLTETTDEHYAGLQVKWLTGVLSGQGSTITAYDGTGKVLTYNAVTDAPGNGDEFVIL